MCFACLCLVSCVPNVASVYGLLVVVLCLVYPMLSVSMDYFSSSCVLCTQCCQCLWIACLRPVSCVPNGVSVYELFFFVLCLVCPMLPVSMDCLSSSCVLCTQCRQCLWIVFLRLVSCVPNVASVYGLHVFVLCLVYPMVSVSMNCFSSSCVPNVVCIYGLLVFVLCLVCPMLPVPLDCPFTNASSSIVYLSSL